MSFGYYPSKMQNAAFIVAYKSHDFPSKRFRFDGLQMTRIGAAKRHDRHRDRPPTAIAAPD